MLVAHLPRESSLVIEEVGEPATWAVTDHLLAHTVDGINALLYAYVSSHSKSKPTAPKPVPRPQTRASNAQREPMSSPNDIKAFMANINGR